MGRLAATLGIGTPDVARIHKRAVASLTVSGKPAGRLKETMERSRTFLADAVGSIEAAHCHALGGGVRVTRLIQSLRSRTLAVVAADQRLKEGVRLRYAAEAALRKSVSRQSRRMAEAQRLQKQLRRMMRAIMSAHEDERRKTSRHLRDEISQALLGIHVRLLTLKTAAENDSENLQKEIDETKRLVGHLSSSLQVLRRKR